MHEVGVVHGDLSTSNFIHRGEDIAALIDWEIPLETMRGNAVELRSTAYVLHPEDLALGQVTKKTDRFAIAALTLISLANPRWRSHLSRNLQVRLWLLDLIADVPTMSKIAEMAVDLIESHRTLSASAFDPTM